MRAGAAAYGAYNPIMIPYTGSIILPEIKKKVNSQTLICRSDRICFHTYQIGAAKRASHARSSMVHSFINNSDLLNSQGFSLHTPYASRMAPRSRRDKVMSDNKANKPTIRVFKGWNFAFHPAKPANYPLRNGFPTK